MHTLIIAKTFVFNDQHQVLLLRRSDNDTNRPGEFDLPGGEVDRGESYQDGAIREALEEAGLVLDPATTELVYASPKLGRDNKGQATNIVRLLYIAKVNDSTVRLSHEHKSYKWYSIDDAIAESAVSYPIYAEVLSYLRDNNIASEYWS